MASSEATRAGADEALLFNERDEVVEATSANFFWVTGGVVSTPALDSGALAGVTRGWVLELAADLGYEVREQVLTRNALAGVESAFLTSSVQELQRLNNLDGRKLGVTAEVGALHRAYRARVVHEYGL
jgi:branched-subunit amino acid aminotransferase/4-amino-4-deoxychorismate lyase